MPEEYEVTSLDAMRDMDEENGTDGMEEERTYLFNIQTTIQVRAYSLEEAEAILMEYDGDDVYNSKYVTVMDNDVMFVEED